MNNIRVTLAVVLLTLFPPLKAEAFTYSSGSLSHTSSSISHNAFPSNLDAASVKLSGSIRINNYMAVGLSVSDDSIELSEAGVEVDGGSNSASIELTLHAPLTPATDLIGRYGYRESIGELTGVNRGRAVSESLDGASKTLSLGVRSMASESLELNGMLLQSTDDNNEPSTSVSIGISYYVDMDLSLDFRYSQDDESSATLLGVTQYFQP